MIAPDRPPAGFYVYLLVDPRDERPFYAGKGQGWRAWQHERDVRAGRFAANRPKHDRIRDIIEAGRSVLIVIVATFDLESEALNCEFKLVDASPNLLNVAMGGLGGRLATGEMARLRAARQLRLNRIRERERRDAALNDARSRKGQMLAQARTDAQRDEIAHWLDTATGKEAGALLAPRLMKLDAPPKGQRPKAARTGEPARRRKRGKKFGRGAALPVELNPADYALD